MKSVWDYFFVNIGEKLYYNRALCYFSNLWLAKSAYICTKNMKKKKIVFSSSGGSPAMVLLNRIMSAFGSNDIDTIAARIAATCRTTPLLIETFMSDRCVELKGNTADCIDVENDILRIDSENIKVDEDTLIIE